MNDDLKKELRTAINAELLSFAGQLQRSINNRLNAQDEAAAKRHDRVMTTLDGIAKRMSDDDDERTAIISQLNRHEALFKSVATQTGIDLSYE